jgi:hypothetical protein
MFVVGLDIKGMKRLSKPANFRRAEKATLALALEDAETVRHRVK